MLIHGRWSSATAPQTPETYERGPGASAGGHPGLSSARFPEETRPRLTCLGHRADTPSPTRTDRPVRDGEPGGAGMIAPPRRIHTPVVPRTTGAPTTGMVDTRPRACARAGSPTALFCVRERDRVLRPDRRARPSWTTGHLAARGTDARDHPGGHARPLREQRILGFTRALTPPSATPRSFSTNESRRLRRDPGRRQAHRAAGARARRVPD